MTRLDAPNLDKRRETFPPNHHLIEYPAACMIEGIIPKLNNYRKKKPVWKFDVKPA